MNEDNKIEIVNIVKDTLEIVDVMSEHTQTSLCFKCPCCGVGIKIGIEHDPIDKVLIFNDLEQIKDLE